MNVSFRNLTLNQIHNSLPTAPEAQLFVPLSLKHEPPFLAASSIISIDYRSRRNASVPGNGTNCVAGHNFIGKSIMTRQLS